MYLEPRVLGAQSRQLHRRGITAFAQGAVSLLPAAAIGQLRRVCTTRPGSREATPTPLPRRA